MITNSAAARWVGWQGYTFAQDLALIRLGDNIKGRAEFAQC